MGCGCSTTRGDQDWERDIAKYREEAFRLAEEALAANSGVKFESRYRLLKYVGHGAFAKVEEVEHRETKQKYACKIINKKTMPNPSRNPEARRAIVVKEIALMKLLEVHPNMVSLYEVFEDDTNFHLVMELCSGGEMFDQIVKKKHYSEKEAAEKMRCLVDFLAFAHSRGVVHRDLKPENILLSSTGADARLKVIDFGSSEFCTPNGVLLDKLGTPYYVAPEVLGRHGHGQKADVWSAGVIMFILLSGYPPFGGSSDASILERVKRGHYTFAGPEWEQVSNDAKQCIRKMLVLQPAKRISASALLEERWFKHVNQISDKALGNQMLRRLKDFAAMSGMKQLAMVLLARTFTDKDVRRLKEVFWQMDKDKNGEINPRELREALLRGGITVPPEAEFVKLFEASDLNRSGNIDYLEFVATMLDSDRVSKRDDVIKKTFEQFDVDRDGFITLAELSTVTKSLNLNNAEEVAKNMIEENDTNGDGKIDFEEFKSMIQATGPSRSSRSMKNLTNISASSGGGSMSRSNSAKRPDGVPSTPKSPAAASRFSSKQSFREPAGAAADGGSAVAGPSGRAPSGTPRNGAGTPRDGTKTPREGSRTPRDGLREAPHAAMAVANGSPRLTKEKAEPIAPAGALSSHPLQLRTGVSDGSESGTPASARRAGHSNMYEQPQPVLPGAVESQ